MTIADFAIVDVFEPMKVRVGEYARRARFRSHAGESDISRTELRSIDLEFIQTRLNIAGAGDRKAKPFGFDRREPVDVSTGIDRSAQQL